MPKILSRPVLATPPQEDMLAEFTRITNGHERRNAHEGRKERRREGGKFAAVFCFSGQFGDVGKLRRHDRLGHHNPQAMHARSRLESGVFSTDLESYKSKNLVFEIC